MLDLRSNINNRLGLSSHLAHLTAKECIELARSDDIVRPAAKLVPVRAVLVCV